MSSTRRYLGYIWKDSVSSAKWHSLQLRLPKNTYVLSACMHIHTHTHTLIYLKRTKMRNMDYCFAVQMKLGFVVQKIFLIFYCFLLHFDRDGLVTNFVKTVEKAVRLSFESILIPSGNLSCYKISTPGLVGLASINLRVCPQN